MLFIIHSSIDLKSNETSIFTYVFIDFFFFFLEFWNISLSPPPPPIYINLDKYFFTFFFILEEFKNTSCTFFMISEIFLG